MEKITFKTYLHFMLVTVISIASLATSCDIEDTERMAAISTDKPITFATATAEAEEQTAGSRAATPLSDFYKDFRIYGYKNTGYDTTTGYTDYQNVFLNSGDKVAWVANTAGTTSSNCDDWEYVNVDNNGQTIKYWDYAATAYRFFGLAPSTYSAACTTNAKNATLTFAVDATASDNTPYFSKLWFSDNTGYGNTVRLQFVRPLCKVRFVLIDANTGSILTTTTMADDTYKYTDVIAANSISFAPTATDDGKMVTKGKLKVTYPLTGTETTESYVISDDATATTISAMTLPYEETDNLCFAYDSWDYTTSPATLGTPHAQNWYTLLPNTSQGTYTFSIILRGLRRTAIVPAEYMQWRANHEYTYYFKVSDQDVSFNTVLEVYTKWQTGASQTESW